MTKPPSARYRTTNWQSYNASLKRRGSLLIWLDEDMLWGAAKAGRPGRPLVFSDAAIQFCLMVKVLFDLPLFFHPAASGARRWFTPVGAG